MSFHIQVLGADILLLELLSLCYFMLGLWGNYQAVCQNTFVHTVFYGPTSVGGGLQSPACLLICLLGSSRPSLVGVKWCLIVVLLCIFLMANGTEHLFMYFLAIVYLLWINIYSDPLPTF